MFDMMTLEEFKSMELDAKGRNAYTAASVESYAETAESLVAELYAANTELEDKMTILADKLEEYMNREESITETLLSAQRVRDSILKDAKTQAEQIIEESNRQARETLDDLKDSVRIEQEKFIWLQKQVSEFKTEILSLYKNHLDSIGALPDYKDEPTVEEVKPKKEEVIVDPLDDRAFESKSFEIPGEESEKGFDVNNDFLGSESTEGFSVKF